MAHEVLCDGADAITGYIDRISAALKADPLGITVVRTAGDLRALSAQLDTRPDWHEPDEQGATATINLATFDNASSRSYLEHHVVVRHNGRTVALVNLALLFGIANGGVD